MMRSGPFLLAVALLTVIQGIVPELVFSNALGLELSLLLVIFAGFHLPLATGSVASFVLGYAADALTSSIPGAYTTVYLLVFALSSLVFPKVYGGRTGFIVLFTLLCGLGEGVFIATLAWFSQGFFAWESLLRFTLPQACILGVLSPWIIHLLRHTIDEDDGRQRLPQKRT